MVNLVNWQQEEPNGCGGGRQPSMDGTSRVTGDCHARFCERLGVKFPGPTRRCRVTGIPTATGEYSNVRTPRIMLTASGTRIIAKTGRYLPMRHSPAQYKRATSGVCGSAPRRFLRFSRLSPVHASRKLTAAAEHGEFTINNTDYLSPIAGPERNRRYGLPRDKRPFSCERLRFCRDGSPRSSKVRVEKK